MLTHTHKITEYRGFKSRSTPGSSEVKLMEGERLDIIKTVRIQMKNTNGRKKGGFLMTSIF